MKNFFLSLATKIAGIVIVGLIAVAIYSNLTEVGAFFSGLWGWVTRHWLSIFFAGVIIGVTGFELKKYNWAHPFSGKNSRTLKKIGKIMLIASPIIIALDLFPFFNSLGLMKIFLTVFGGIILVAISVLAIILLDHLLSKRTERQEFWIYVGAVIGLLAICYYLDINIFSWRPWITLIVGGIILAYLGIVAIINYSKKVAQAKREKKAAELKLKEEKSWYDGFSTLPPLAVALACIRLGAKTDSKSITMTGLAFTALAKLIVEANPGLSTDDLAEVCNKIRHTNYQLDRDFLELIASECLRQKEVELILITNSFLPSKLPILFANSSKKKAIVDAYLKDEASQEVLRRLLFNKVKREFKPSILTGVIDILAFAYDKESGENTLEELIKQMQSLLDFACECLPKIRKPEEAKNLRSLLMTKVAILNAEGIDVENPKEDK